MLTILAAVCALSYQFFPFLVLKKGEGRWNMAVTVDSIGSSPWLYNEESTIDELSVYNEDIEMDLSSFSNYITELPSDYPLQASVNGFGK